MQESNTERFENVLFAHVLLNIHVSQFEPF